MGDLSNPPSRERWIVFGVVSLGFLVLSPGVLWGLPAGKAVVGAYRVLDGEAPYRDFWTMYAPGQFYLTASLFGLFGRELVVQGIAAVLVYAMAGGTFFVLLRQVGAERGPALAAWLVFIVMFWQAGPELTSYPPALLCLLLALHKMLRYFRSGAPAALLQAGVWCGVAALFKHDVAGYVAVAILISLFVAHGLTGSRRPPEWDAPLGAALRFGVGCLVPLLPAAVWFAWLAGGEILQDILVFPATVYPAVFGEPYARLFPPLRRFLSWLGEPGNLRMAHGALSSTSSWLLCNLPQFVFAVGVVTVFARRSRLTPRQLSSAVLFLSAMPFFWLAAHVQKNTHLYSMAICSMLLGAMAWSSVSRAGSAGRRFRIALGLTFCLYGIGLWIPTALNVAQALMGLSGARLVGLPGSAGVWVSSASYDVYHPISEFVREHIDDEERIYVGVQRHDAIVIGDMRWYYLTQRRSCCRYNEMHPGVVDRPDVQQEIIDGIERHGVRCVILWQFGWPDSRLDKIKRRRMGAVDDVGATLLDEFIAASFDPIVQHGEHVVLWRKGLPLPGSDASGRIGSRQP